MTFVLLLIGEDIIALATEQTPVELPLTALLVLPKFLGCFSSCFSKRLAAYVASVVPSSFVVSHVPGQAFLPLAHKAADVAHEGVWSLGHSVGVGDPSDCWSLGSGLLRHLLAQHIVGWLVWQDKVVLHVVVALQTLQTVDFVKKL